MIKLSLQIGRDVVGTMSVVFECNKILGFGYLGRRL